MRHWRTDTACHSFGSDARSRKRLHTREADAKSGPPRKPSRYSTRSSASTCTR